jgi:hypothetical protein
MEPTVCTPRDVLLAVREDVVTHHHAGLVGRRLARQRDASLRVLARALGDDLDHAMGRDELWALHERATSLTRDRRTAESVRGVVGRHLLDLAVAQATPPAPGVRRGRTPAPPLLH